MGQAKKIINLLKNLPQVGIEPRTPAIPVGHDITCKTKTYKILV